VVRALGGAADSSPALGLSGVAVKISALRWFLDEDDAVLDTKGIRQLRALDREVRELAERCR